LNSTWNTNIALFKKRFPALGDMLKDDIAFFEKECSEGHFPLPLEFIEAKNGSPTALFKTEIAGTEEAAGSKVPVQDADKSTTAKAAAIPLHSKYNPEREAEQLVSQFSRNEFDAAVFLGFGLGYGPLAFAEKNPSAPMILIENNPLFLFAALNTLDFTKVLSHPSLVFVTKADPATAVSLLSGYRAERVKIFSAKAHTAHDTAFASQFLELFKRSLQKDAINTNTLEKFSRLWMKNSLANLFYLAKCDGVKKYRSALLQLGGNAAELPFVILAAGPSLAAVIPHLQRLKESCVLVCVDTALHAVLKAGVEPDFIVLVDPQYACARHLEFLKSPSSVLITESAAYPSVFRFECRETIMCSSLFPIGQYFESRLGQKGKLGAGGSVATTAWDFARTCGAKKIYIAGMDLGFPGKQTHIRGSQFEERAHRTSCRTHTAESDGVSSLLGAAPTLAKDYRGKDILTDKRMSLFAWWFESNCATALKDGQKTFTLTPQSLAIPNIAVSSAEELLEECSAQKEQLVQSKEKFLEQAEKNSTLQKNEDEKNGLPSFESVRAEFRESLENLAELSKRGLALCQVAIQNRTKVQEVNAKLSEIDAKIMSSKGKEAASLVFPTERQLAAKAGELPPSAINDALLSPVYYSRLIYGELQKAVRAYLECMS